VQALEAVTPPETQTTTLVAILGWALATTQEEIPSRDKGPAAFKTVSLSRTRQLELLSFEE
jgi:hypothetical protein